MASRWVEGLVSVFAALAESGSVIRCCSGVSFSDDGEFELCSNGRARRTDRPPGFGSPRIGRTSAASRVSIVSYSTTSGSPGYGSHAEVGANAVGSSWETSKTSPSEPSPCGVIRIWSSSEWGFPTQSYHSFFHSYW